MRSWSKRSADNLQGIHPDLRKVMDRALTISPLDFTVIEGLRTVERQRELVSQGFSKTMRSRHLTGHAVDIWPIDPATKRLVSGRDPRLWDFYDKLAPWVKKAAGEVGVPIEWGGDWRTFRDGPHFQLPWASYP